MSAVIDDVCETRCFLFVPLLFDSERDHRSCIDSLQEREIFVLWSALANSCISVDLKIGLPSLQGVDGQGPLQGVVARFGQGPLRTAGGILSKQQAAVVESVMGMRWSTADEMPLSLRPCCNITPPSPVAGPDRVLSTNVLQKLHLLAESPRPPGAAPGFNRHLLLELTRLSRRLHLNPFASFSKLFSGIPGLEHVENFGCSLQLSSETQRRCESCISWSSSLSDVGVVRGSSPTVVELYLVLPDAEEENRFPDASGDFTDAATWQHSTMIETSVVDERIQEDSDENVDSSGLPSFSHLVSVISRRLEEARSRDELEGEYIAHFVRNFFSQDLGFVSSNVNPQRAEAARPPFNAMSSVRERIFDQTRRIILSAATLSRYPHLSGKQQRFEQFSNDMSRRCAAFFV